MPDRLLVLCWHNVECTYSFPAPPNAGLVGLEAQLRFLRRWANVVPLEQALAALVRGTPLPPRAVALSFDDGYRDTYELALPLLDRLSLPATFFLVPGLLSREVSAWWEQVAKQIAHATAQQLGWRGTALPLATQRDRAAATAVVQRDLKEHDHKTRLDLVNRLAEDLAPRNSGDEVRDLFMDWDQAADLVKRGYTVGSHTCAHAILSRESAVAQACDIAASRRELQEALAVEVTALAYPNGEIDDFDEQTLQAARSAGHEWGLTTVQGFNGPQTDPLRIRRSVTYPDLGVPHLLRNLRRASKATNS